MEDQIRFRLLKKFIMFSELSIVLFIIQNQLQMNRIRDFLIYLDSDLQSVQTFQKIKIQQYQRKQTFLNHSDFYLIVTFSNKNYKVATQMIREFIIILFFCQCFSRFFETSMKFSQIGRNDGWIYLNKMSFAPGLVSYKVRTSTSGIPYGNGGIVTVQAIPQHLWSAQKARKCQSPSKEPLIDHNISFSSQSDQVSYKSFQIEEPTLYYFVLKDCLRTLKEQYQNENLNLHVYLHSLNNGRQVGQEEDHWYIIPVIILTGMWLAYFYTKKLKGTDMKSHFHKFIMFIGVATQVSSLTWRTFGFIIYTYTGFDYGFFHFIYLFMHSMSESIVIGLVILIGFGWTINFMTIQHAGIYLPIALVLALVNAVLTLLSKFATNHHDRHHLFDNFNGNILIAYRLFFLLIFVAGIIYTYSKSRAKVKNFIVIFGFFGSLYIAALPIIIYIGNNFIEPKDRHQFVFVAVEALKCIINIALSLMLNLQKSQYNQISYQNRSFVPEESKYF